MRAVIELDLPEPQQTRSLKTQQSFVDAGWEILRTQSWENVSITAIAKKAGRSVGVFYQRFGSKEDFLTVLLNRWLETSYSSLNSWPPAETGKELFHWYLRDAFERIRANRYLWRAALQRSWDDPVFWEPFRIMGARRRDVLSQRLGDLRGIPLNDAEENRLGEAIQVFNSVLNNALLNDPGPLRIDQPEFLPRLEEICLSLAGLDL
jgi:AcrR family transcriptional regulator